MNVLYTISELDTIQEPIVYGMGTFDGLHLGHQSIIKEVVDSAKEYKGASVIVTFDAIHLLYYNLSIFHLVYCNEKNGMLY